MTTYAGFYVLDSPRPAVDGYPADDYQRGMSVLDNRTGKRAGFDHGGAPVVSRPFLWWCSTRAEIAALRAFVAQQKGQLVPFWLPTYRHDLVLSTATVVGSPALVVKSCEYTRHQYPNRARRHLVIMPTTGSWIYRKVTNAVDNGDGTETLTLDSNVGAVVSPGAGMVSFLTLCRLASDTVEIAYSSAITAEAVLRMQEIRQEVPA